MFITLNYRKLQHSSCSSQSTNNYNTFQVFPVCCYVHALVAWLWPPIMGTLPVVSEFDSSIFGSCWFSFSHPRRPPFHVYCHIVPILFFRFGCCPTFIHCGFGPMLLMLKSSHLMALSPPCHDSLRGAPLLLCFSHQQSPAIPKGGPLGVEPSFSSYIIQLSWWYWNLVPLGYPQLPLGFPPLAVTSVPC